MITIKQLPFNPFQVNTYVVYDETKECLIIDAGMQGQQEEEFFINFIESNSLKPVKLINTHAHIDHIIGNHFVANKFDLKLTTHPDCVNFLRHAPAYAETFGLKMSDVKQIDDFVEEGEEIKFGNSSLQVLHTPGHADGSICLYSSEGGFVITGDVLFNQSIGRTDLPTGNYDLLQKSIWEKVFTLPDETVAWPGHGPETKIGFEKIHNPFVAIGKDLL